MVCDANERTVGLVGVNTHDQQVRPLRQCRDGNPPRRNQGCIRPVSCPPVPRGWCLGPGRVSNNDLPPAFGAAPQPARDRCHQGNARRSTLAEQIRPPSRPKHSATEGYVTVTARPNRCHTLSRPLQRVYCRINLYGIKRAACGGADMAEFVVLLTCPHGPIPLAARGLAAVLARAGPAGAVADQCPGRQRRRGFQGVHPRARPVVGQLLTRPRDRSRRADAIKAASRRTRWPAASLDTVTATRLAAGTRGWPGSRCCSSCVCRPRGGTCSCSTSRPTTSICPLSSVWTPRWSPMRSGCCLSSMTVGCPTLFAPPAAGCLSTARCANADSLGPVADPPATIRIVRAGGLVCTGERRWARLLPHERLPDCEESRQIATIPWLPGASPPGSSSATPKPRRGVRPPPVSIRKALTAIFLQVIGVALASLKPAVRT
jgi:hypothetical protein